MVTLYGTFREDEGESDHHREEHELEGPPLDAVDPRVSVDRGDLAEPLQRFAIIWLFRTFSISRLHFC